MAGQTGGPPPYLINDLLKNPKAYSFFQAVRLLRLVSQPDGDESEQTFMQDTLRIRPLLSLSFPGTDLFDVQETPFDDKVHYIITATFLGLYGPSSPLPTHYTEDLLDDASEDKTVVRDFLDILSSPFYKHFFQIWSKYRWYYKLFEKEDPTYYERLYCLLGLDTKESRRAVPQARQLLRYIGLFTQFPRSALGLKTLLSDALNITNLDVVPNILRRVIIPLKQRCLLGRQATTLGQDLYLGEEIEDRMGKIRIQAGPLTEVEFHALLPDSPKFDEAKNLTVAFLDQPLERELGLILYPEEARTIHLGESKWSHLGYDTWTFSGECIQEEPSVTFQMVLS